MTKLRNWRRCSLGPLETQVCGLLVQDISLLLLYLAPLRQKYNALWLEEFDLMIVHLNCWPTTGEFLWSWVLFKKWWFSCRKPVEGNSPWMYVTMMMTDQIPLELPPLLNGEVAMMPHLVNGDAAQQVGAGRGKLSHCPIGRHELRSCFILRLIQRCAIWEFLLWLSG